MFGIGPMELVIIAIVAIVFVGPKNLPEMMKKLGKAFVQVRRQTQEIRDGFQDVVKDAERELELERIRELKEKMQSMQPKNMIESAIKEAGKVETAEPKAKDEHTTAHDYHEAHYDEDGNYVKPDPDAIFSDKFEDRGWEHLIPKKEDSNPDQSAEEKTEEPSEKNSKPEGGA